MKTTNVFHKNLIAYNNKERLIINQGGTRSSKTYSILQLLFLIALRSKKSRIISIISYALPHLRLGAMRDFDNILLEAGMIPDNYKNKTDNYYKIGNSIIEFWGTENLAKVHGPARDILFCNEINHIKKDVYDNLAVRTSEVVFADYNPTQEFWLQTELMPFSKHTFIKSTYKDNEYLSAEIIAEIESRKHNENWWRVYGLGEQGILEGTILTNWTFGEFDNSLPYGFGLDFGFFPDPDAFIKVAINEKLKKIYLKECFYNNNQQLSNLKEAIKIHCQRNNLIIADSAESRLISDLSNDFNIKKVSKYAGSVIEGIRLLQDYELIIEENSYNLIKELNNYVWNDKKAGIPIDAYNHLIDALRYYVQTNTKPQPKGIIRRN